MRQGIEGAHVDNPYQAPAAYVEDGERPALPIVPASKLRRFLNWLIDKGATLLLAGAAGFLAALIGGEPVIAWLESLNRWQEILIGIPIVLLYYVTMEGTFGITLGKLCTSTCVVNDRGRPISFRQALVRSVCRHIPFDGLSLLASDDDHPRGWHDSLARTHVVLRQREIVTMEEGTRGQSTICDSTTMSST